MLSERLCNWRKKSQFFSLLVRLLWPVITRAHVHVPSLSLGMQRDVPLSQRPLSYASQLKCMLHTITGVYQVKDTLDEVKKEKRRNGRN